MSTARNSSTTTTETIKLISSEVDETRAKLAESQAQIKVLKEKYRGSLPQDLDDNVRALQALQMQVERKAPGAAKTDASDGIGTSPAPKANTPEAALAALKTKLVALRAQYSDEYPEVIETQSQIAILEKEIANPVQAAVAVGSAGRFGGRFDPAANGRLSAQNRGYSGA